ncbi:MAG: T9SS type A sorting domain-containing protein [Bacteroidetes bacterium]|nr:T9SS type A sorting domain-containing protein [Bacteroidota bacterium]
MKILTFCVLIGILMILCPLSKAQTRTKLTTPYDHYSNFCESYDHGFLVAGESPGWYNLNYGLVAKTDINGNIIWKRYVGDTSCLTSFRIVHPTADGGCVAAGKSYTYNGPEYPLFVKFNECGRVEWSRKIPCANMNNRSDIVELSDGSYVAVYTVDFDPDWGVSNTLLLNLDQNGNLLEIDTLDCGENGGTAIGFVNLIKRPSDILFIQVSPSVIGGSSVILETDRYGNIDWTLNCWYGESGIFTTDVAEDGTYYSSGFALGATHNDHGIVFKTSDGNMVWTKSLHPDTTNWSTGALCVFNNTRYLATYEDGQDHLAVYDSTGTALSRQTDIHAISALARTTDNKIMALGNYAMQLTPHRILGKYRMTSDLGSVLEDSLNSSNYAYDTLCPVSIETDTLEITPELITSVIKTIHTGVKDCLFELYPTPASGKFTIRFYQAVTETGIVQLYDIKGQLVYQSILNKGIEKMEISTGGLIAGVYWLKVQTGDSKTGMRKIVLE